MFEVAPQRFETYDDVGMLKFEVYHHGKKDTNINRLRMWNHFEHFQPSRILLRLMVGVNVWRISSVCVKITIYAFAQILKFFFLLRPPLMPWNKLVTALSLDGADAKDHEGHEIQPGEVVGAREDCSEVVLGDGPVQETVARVLSQQKDRCWRHVAHR